MSILRYFKPKDGLPDPTGALSTSVPSAAIAQANREVQKAVTSSDKLKRGPYTKFSAGLRAEIGKYSSYHGVAAASRHFSRKLSKRVSETTVRSITRSPSRSFLQLRRTYPLYFVALVHTRVLRQQLLPISRNTRGSHEHSRLFVGRARSWMPSLPARVKCLSMRKNYFRVNFFRVNKFSWVAGPTKKNLHENFLRENFTTRKFPDLRYIAGLGKLWLQGILLG